ncbi:MAG: peptide ABC transporter substrate-binding protein [Pseudomonadota bacterium]
MKLKKNLQTYCYFYLAIIISMLYACTLQKQDKLKNNSSYNSEFNVSIGNEPESIDPAKIVGTIGMDIAINIFEGLTTHDPRTLNRVPGIAQSWSVSEDATQYIFQLRKNAIWTDGKPVTALDFISSWERVLNPKTSSAYAFLMYSIKGAREYNQGKYNDFSKVSIKAIDHFTLQVDLVKPTHYFLDLTSFVTFLPIRIDIINKYQDNWTKPENIITNGPFRLTSWQPNQKLTIEKSPRYWDSDFVRMSRINFHIVEDVNTEEKMFQTGALDMTSQILGIKIDKHLKNPEFHYSPFLGNLFIRFNTTKKPFNDIKVRKAFSLAIDRDKLCKFVAKGRVPAYSLTPPGIEDYSPPNVIEYDIEKAKALLKEAGYENGKDFPEFEILYNTEQDIKKIMLAIQEMWKKNLGIDVTLINQEWKVYLSNLFRMNFDLVRSSWIGDYLDPNTFLDLWVSKGDNNLTAWSNLNFDKLIEEASIEVNPRNRFNLLKKAEKILLEEMPIIPIYYYTSQFLLKANVKGIYPNLKNLHPLKYVFFESQ